MAATHSYQSEFFCGSLAELNSKLSRLSVIPGIKIVNVQRVDQYMNIQTKEYIDRYDWFICKREWAHD